MTLTQMIDMLTGKENKLFKNLQVNFDLHGIFLEEVEKLEVEVNKPAKQQDPERIKMQFDSVRYYSQ